MKFFIILIIPIMVTLGCSTDDSDAVTIDENCTVTEEFSPIEPVRVPDTDSIKLNSIFSADNDCLTWEQDPVLITINSAEGFKEIDNCNTVEFIDFSAYTLVTGRITTPSISDNIVSKTLWVQTEEKSGIYKIEVKKCIECWTAIGTHYFWALYPKVETSFDISLCVSNK